MVKIFNVGLLSIRHSNPNQHIDDWLDDYPPLATNPMLIFDHGTCVNDWTCSSVSVTDCGNTSWIFLTKSLHSDLVLKNQFVTTNSHFPRMVWAYYPLVLIYTRMSLTVTQQLSEDIPLFLRFDERWSHSKRWSRKTTGGWTSQWCLKGSECLIHMLTMPTRLSWTTTQHAAPRVFIRSWRCHHDIPIQIGGSLGGISERLSRSKKHALAIIQGNGFRIPDASCKSSFPQSSQSGVDSTRGGDDLEWPMNWESHALRDGWTMLKILLSMMHHSVGEAVLEHEL